MATDLGIIQIYDINRAVSLQSYLLPDAKQIPSSITFSPDENSLIVGTRTMDCSSCSKAGQIAIIDVKSGLTTFLPQQKQMVHRITFIDEDTFLTAGGDIKLWKWSTRTELPTPAAFESAKGFAIYEAGRKIAILTNNEVQFWDLQNLVKVGESLSFKGSYNMLSVSESGRMVALSDPTRFEVQIFDREKITSTPQILRGHEDEITDLLFYDEQILVSSSFDSKIKVWSITDMKEDLTFAKHSDFVMGLFKRPGHPGIYSFSIDGTVRGWTLDFNDIRTQLCREFATSVREQCKI